MAPKRVLTVHTRTFQPQLETRDLPKGVCGRVTGVALVYGVEDDYGTRFARGCLDRTKREKLAAGKVSLFVNHEYGIHSHVGVVRSLSTTGDEEMMAADLFDTEEGRKAKEYVEAVIAAGGYTGFSVGFYDRSDTQSAGTPGATYTFTEIELSEVSLTPRPAVPGADVTGVRQGQQAAWRLFEAALAVLPLDEVHARVGALMQGDADTADRAEPGHTPAPEPDAASSDSRPANEPVDWADRLRAVAAHYREEMHRVGEDSQHQG